ncbi:MAG TPA: NAD(P)H-dependent oxidoreductase [Geminicoccaceae bacterium]|nr:NAD(P)H-dependent oxidoreductase [Geminicoccaceae bacterium]
MRILQPSPAIAEAAAGASVEARRAALKVLIIVGHPRKASFCGALARAYRKGAARAGVELRELWLADLRFDRDVRSFHPAAQPVEKDLRHARRLIAWADHLVFVYPTWWGTMPGLLKAFLDRVLAPGFAFEELPDGWRPLLRGRSADLVTTMDTPGWVYRWIYGAPGHNAMKHASLGFCGIATSRVLRFGPIKGSAPAQRQAWLEMAERRGHALAQGAFSPARRIGRSTLAWLQALRLQFHPMAWLAYLLGALLASTGGSLDVAVFWWGLATLFFLEAATVLSNDLLDLESDRVNVNFGPFTGGSRILVDGRLGIAAARRAIAATLCLALVCGAAALTGTAQPAAGGALLLAMAALALGYTLPPLALSHRGLGELDVGLTHATGAILCGFVLQGGALADPAPWLLSLPLGLAVLPSIVLAGVPDRAADRSIGKGTLAVRLGVRGASMLAGSAAVLAAATALVLIWTTPVGGLLAGIEYLAPLHAMLLLILLARLAPRGDTVGRIDGLMLAALTFMLWFVAVPLRHLLG